MVSPPLNLSMVPINCHLWHRCPNFAALIAYRVVPNLEVPFTPSFRRQYFPYPDGGKNTPRMYPLVGDTGATGQLLQN